MAESQSAYLLSVVLSLLGLLATAFVHGLGYFQLGVDWGLFDHDQEQTWLSFSLRVAEVRWFFYIWIVMYALQIFWVFYGLIALWKETKQGWLAAHPPILPSIQYVAFLLGLAGTLGWVVMWDRRDMVSYSVMTCGAATVFYTCALGISVYSVKKHSATLRLEGFGGHVTFMRLFMHNAIAALVAWLPCVTAYVAAITLRAEDVLSRDNSEYVALGVIGGYVLLWTIVDLCAFGSVTSHVFTPYLVYVLACVMPLYVNWDEADRNKLFNIGVGLTCASLFLILVKISVNLGRCCSRQVNRDHKEDFVGGAVEYQEPEYEYNYDTGHNSSQVGLVHY